MMYSVGFHNWSTGTLGSNFAIDYLKKKKIMAVVYSCLKL